LNSQLCNEKLCIDEVGYTKKVESVNWNQGRHHTFSRAWLWLSASTSAANIDEHGKNQCRIGWGPAKQIPMRKIRLLHTIWKQQQNKKYLPNPEGFH
jgi:hypothetical protein